MNICKKCNSLQLPELKVKNGVIINGAHFYPEMVRILNVARVTAPELTDNTIWVTSANDSAHMSGSLHYENKAFDLRTWNIVGGEKSAEFWVARMALALGGDYDVILEKDHIHIELDPEV